MCRDSGRGTKRLLAMLIAALLCLGLRAQAAQTPNRNLSLGEETWYMSMLSHEGRLLALGQEGLVELSTQDGQASLLSAEIRGGYGPRGAVEGVDVLLSEGGALYALNSGTGALYALSLTPSPALTPLQTFGALEGGSLGNWFIQEGQLVGFNSYAGQIWQGDIRTGKGQQRPLTGVELLSPYQPGSYAALTRRSGEGGRELGLSALDSGDLSLSPLADLTGTAYPSAMAFDEVNGALILAGRSGLTRWQPGGAPREAAFYAPGDAAQLVVLAPEMVSLTVDGLLVVRSLRPEALAGRRVLSIMDPLGRGADYLSFIQGQPDVDLKFVDVMEEEGAEERFIQHMLTRDDSVDIYLLRDQNLLDVLKRKGYALDMTQDPALARRAERMLPALRQAFGDEQRLLAFPKEFFLTLLSYHPESFEKLKLTVPTTYREYYQLCLDFLSAEAPEREGYRLLPFDSNMDLLNLLRRRADELSAQGQPLVFNTPEMVELLRLYHALTKLPPAMPEGQATWLFYQYSIPAKGEYEYLPLSFDQKTPFTLGFLPGELKYFVINPYSKSPELALQLIEGFAQGLIAQQEMVLYTDQRSPVPNPDYEARIQRQEERLAAFEKGMEEASEIERRQMADQLHYMREDLERARESSRFLITQDEVDSWLRYAPQVYVSPFNPIPLLASVYPEFFNSIHSDPSFSPENFLSQLDEMVGKAVRE